MTNISLIFFPINGDIVVIINSIVDMELFPISTVWSEPFNKSEFYLQADS